MKDEVFKILIHGKGKNKSIKYSRYVTWEEASLIAADGLLIVKPTPKPKRFKK